MTAQTDWASAVAILASGLILGLMFMYFFRRGKSRIAVDGEMRDLEAKRDALLQLIPSAEGEERRRLEQEAANVLREIDQAADKRPVMTVAVEEPRQVRRLSSSGGGFIWGVVSTLALVGLVLLVNKFAGTREQQTAPAAMQSTQPPPDPALQGLEARVQAEPDNLDMRIELARAYLERDNMIGVFEQTQYVLSKSPQNSRALTYQALVKMAMGDSVSANQMLQQALKSDPSLLDAWVTLAWVQTQEGKTADAEKTMREAMRRHPEEQARLQQVLDQMKAHPPTTAEPPRAAPSAESVRITIESATRSEGTLFVIVRAAGVSAGPPVAAKRVDATAFPMTLELTSADSMMGQPLPPTMRIEVRLDSDGNAMTRTPGDPAAVQDGVVAGSAIKLNLR